MQIEVPIGGIVIELGSPDPDNPHRSVCGSIVEGTLKGDCEFGDNVLDNLFNNMMDALESILLAHACAGIDVTTPAYIEGLETAIDACINAI